MGKLNIGHNYGLGQDCPAEIMTQWTLAIRAIKESLILSQGAVQDLPCSDLSDSCCLFTCWVLTQCCQYSPLPSDSIDHVTSEEKCLEQEHHRIMFLLLCDILQFVVACISVRWYLHQSPLGRSDSQLEDRMMAGRHDMTENHSSRMIVIDNSSNFNRIYVYMDIQINVFVYHEIKWNCVRRIYD